ncbi:hypothetical protein CK203_068952 [Vitis vinifera]|uniref:Uncharacterized protein n=1 Tax=Vitis vinifera TaxID=29760 RepID=A0A438F180_VITVI|nr:hypothetical protein CK203_068952 [Vitis vinifera]
MQHLWTSQIMGQTVRKGPGGVVGLQHRVEGGSSSPILVERVWARMKEWFSGEVRCVWGEGGDNDLVVERVVRKEVVGKVGLST